MPIYSYGCQKCNYEFEVFQLMKAEPLTLCPECCHMTLSRIFDVPNVICHGEPQTLDQLAEANSKKFGREECQERELKSKERVNKFKAGRPTETPLWRNGSIPGLIKKSKPLEESEIKEYADELRAMGNTVNLNAVPPKAKRRKVKDGTA